MRSIALALSLILACAWVASGQAQISSPSPVTIATAIPGGSNIIGRVGIDQTTPGTTNLVSIGTYSYSHVSAQGTQTIKQAAGTLHSVVVNSSAVSPCTATLYDSIGSSLTVIAVIDCSNTFPRNYDVAFATGLTISVNANPSPDLTITYQ
jgi:hypothetical protein